MKPAFPRYGLEFFYRVFPSRILPTGTSGDSFVATLGIRLITNHLQGTMEGGLKGRAMGMTKAFQPHHLAIVIELRFLKPIIEGIQNDGLKYL
jgi:hypothetical protein